MIDFQNISGEKNRINSLSFNNNNQNKTINNEKANKIEDKDCSSILEIPTSRKFIQNDIKQINNENTFNKNDNKNILDNPNSSNTKFSLVENFNNYQSIKRNYIKLNSQLPVYKKGSFKIALKEYFLSIFSKKKSVSMQKYIDFTDVIKELLSVELILKEINEVLDNKKS